MPELTIHLGYEVGTGQPVAVPLRHLAVTGQTQRSGKTTTLEALIKRAGLHAIAFKTKRGETSFNGAHEINPYFHEGANADRPYWELVESLIAAAMKQGMKFERAWIVKAAEGATSLAEVRANVANLHDAARRNMDKDLFMLIGKYLDIVIPQLATLPKADRLTLAPGLNVMDLTGYTEEMQQLLVRSAIEWIHEREQGVVTIMPEAWKFIPETRMTLVKLAAEKLIREGAGLGNMVWMDAQDLAGVWKLMLRAATVWLLGVQREANEIKRTLANIPEDLHKPKRAELMKLGLGQYFVCYEETVKKVYVQPDWLSASDARAVATGQLSVQDVQVHKPKPKPARKEAKPVKKTDAAPGEWGALATHLANLTGAVERLTARLPADGVIAARPAPSGAAGKAGGADAAPLDLDALAAAVAKRLPQQSAPDGGVNVATLAAQVDALAEQVTALIGAGGRTIELHTTDWEMEVHVKREIIKIDGTTLSGRIAMLLREGFFDSPRGHRSVWDEVRRRGYQGSNNTQRELEKLAERGFLVKEPGQGFKAVDKMKVNIIEDK